MCTLYKAVVPYSLFWEDYLFYSHAMTNTVLSREKRKEKKVEKCINFKTVSMGFFVANLSSAYSLG